MSAEQAVATHLISILISGEPTVRFSAEQRWPIPRMVEKLSIMSLNLATGFDQTLAQDNH